MREWIGECQTCGKRVYCENGFFNGEQINGKLICPDCAENRIKNGSSQSD